MKNLFYFSKQKLKFIEITNFHKKFIFMVFFVSFIISFFVFGVYILINDVINPDNKIENLRAENKELIKNLNYLLSQYKQLGENLDTLVKNDISLKLKANLPTNNDEFIELGTGGQLFDAFLANGPSDINNLLGTLNSYVDNLKSKVIYAKNEYKLIETTLTKNEKLYKSIPAIKPTTDGEYANDFGMRMHPVLHIMRMHTGLDILTDIGTKVYVTGAGTVEFVGNKEGYGLTIIVDHGFGYKTLYAHLHKSEVKENQKVERGDYIALSGNSGTLTSGPHLHYEVLYNGVALNPMNFFYDNLTVFDLKEKKQ